MEQENNRTKDTDSRTINVNIGGNQIAQIQAKNGDRASKHLPNITKYLWQGKILKEI